MTDDSIDTAPSDHAIFLEHAKAALVEDDLLEWCRVMAADEDRMATQYAVQQPPMVFHRLAAALEQLGYRPGGQPSRFCVDCRHFSYDSCRRPGMHTFGDVPAWNERALALDSVYGHRCGPAAQFFQPLKDPDEQ